MTQVAPIPAGFQTVTPHLICEGAADAIEFYKKAFNAVELMRMPGPGGKLMHAQIQIGSSMVMLADDFPDWGSLGPRALKGTPIVVHLYVEDTDALYNQAVAAGATSKMPPADMFWGDRYGMVTDPFGHIWSIATHNRDLTPEQMNAEMQKSMSENCPGTQA
jgi:PhnB protein